MSTNSAKNRAVREAQWRSRATERSMRAVLAKAVDRNNRFVSAALELLSEVGSDFSVQDVVERSRTSLRSFYESFNGKDDLLLAIYEEVMISGLAVQEEAAAAAGGNPLDQLRAFLLAEWRDLGSSASKTNRALTLYHQRLASTRPAELTAVLEPQFRALTELMRSCREAGLMHGDARSDGEHAAVLVTLLAAMLQARVLEVQVGGLEPTGEILWSFVSTMFSTS